jgi:hypothetical protein
MQEFILTYTTKNNCISNLLITIQLPMKTALSVDIKKGPIVDWPLGMRLQTY